MVERIRYRVTLKGCPNGTPQVTFDFGYQNTWLGYDEQAVALFRTLYDADTHSLWRVTWCNGIGDEVTVSEHALAA